MLSTVPRPRICLVIGAGAGVGTHVARRFARGGMHAFLVRRSDQEGLNASVHKIQQEEAPGTASGILLNTTHEGALERLVEQVEAEVGEIDTAVYNLGAQIGNVSLEDTSLKQFTLGWQLGNEGLFRLAKVVAPRMVERGRGNLLVTSATAALRGNAGQHSHASAMGGRRMLCQSLAHELAPKGVHICHFVIDGAVDAPDTLGKMLGEKKFAALKAARGDGILQPHHIAETYWHVANQHRSVWTSELDLRPFVETPWFNS
jgi:NAD(P)-dependent dehydrogenase (short-subunit alcohol dehydrogenase family)